MVRILLPKNLRSAHAQALLRHLAVLMMAFVSSAAFAQTTGTIEATVLDGEGIEMPGVKVILAGESGTMGGEQVKTSDDAGKVRFSELLPGIYVLTATKDGFKTASVTGVQVIMNREQAVSITMESGGAVEVIEVVDKAQLVDTTSVTRGEVLTKDFLQKIPAGRSYQSAINMTAGVVDSGNGNPNMGGGAYNENTYMLDGATVTDPVTGTFSMNFNFDAIQQIEVLLGGYEPEYGTSLGGVVNVVTESGTNNLQFDTSLYYENGNWGPKRDARYSADGYQLAPTGFDSSYTSYSLNAKVSGPIVRDKAWYLLSYANQRSLASNVGIDLPRDFDGHYVFAKFTVQPSSDHRLTFTGQSDPTTIDNTEQGSLRIKPEAQGRQVQGGGMALGRWQWFLSPTATLDTSVTYQKSFIEVNGVPCTHDRDLGYHPCEPGEEENAMDWETPGRFGIGGAYDSVNYPQFYFDDRFRYEASSKLSVLGVKDPLGGSHDMKFGVSANQVVWDQITGVNGNTIYYDLNQQSYDPQSIMNYYWVEYSGPTKFRTTGAQWNAFAQDAWQPHPNVTVKYGARIDSAVMRNDVNEPVVDMVRVGPRAFAAWDPFGDGKSKIAGGWGRFNDTGRLDVASFSSKTSGTGYKLFLGQPWDDGEGGGFIGNAGTLYDSSQPGNLNTVNPKLRTPYTDEFLVMAQRELVEDVAVSVNATHKATRELYEYDETNVTYDEDGSSVIGARNGDTLRNIYRMRTPTAALRDYTQLDFSLQKATSRRWAGRVTYTYALSTGTSRGALSGSFANDPQTQYNNGPLIDSDIRHQVKGWAYWDLPTDPWKQTVGASMTYNSGVPFERWYYSEEDLGYGIRIRDRATYGRLPGWWDLSLTFQQDIDVRKGKVTLEAQVYNVLNLQAPQWADTYYIAAENRLLISYRQDPLSAQLGVRYAF